MTRQEFLHRLRELDPEAGFRADPLNPQAILAPARVIPGLFEWLRHDPDAAMDTLEFSTCVDNPPDRLTLVYYLYSYQKGHRLCIKVDLPRENPSVPTLCQLWQNADWNEREIYDLFGVVFVGHPDLRRIMMPEDWEGYPLRKDYLHPNLAVKPDGC